MAKSQLRGNRESKKPKQPKKSNAPASPFIVPPGRTGAPMPSKKG
jgi:hypothetical protein